jgi:hypothetical protein
MYSLFSAKSAFKIKKNEENLNLSKIILKIVYFISNVSS